MNRLTISFLVALIAGAVSGGEAMRSLAALRDGGPWEEAVVAAISGLVLFVSLVVLARIVVATSRPQRRARSRKSG
jgi:hypothetical protein